MDLPKSPFKPINYLIDFQKLEQFQCIICTQKSINIMQCKTCKKCLCNLCAIDQKSKSNKCPYRCSNGPLQLQPLSNLTLSFNCPFSQQCKQKLESIKEFRQHDLKCQLINQQQKQHQRKKWEFKCNNNHSLEIYMEVSKNLRSRKECYQCKQHKMSRVTCKKCNAFYCSDCRPFPILNMKCPSNHEFCKVSFNSQNYVCDLCQCSPAIVGLDFYQDYQCNIGVCDICYKSLPELNKYPAYCQNLNNYCDVVSWIQRDTQQQIQKQRVKQEHRLIILPSQTQRQCGWCQQNKPCYKYCPKCQKYFCFECKIFDILQNGQCQFEHQFYKISNQELDNYYCYKCITNKKLDEKVKMYIDEKCQITLCSKCYKEGKKYNHSVSSRKLMPDNRKCMFGNHAVKFYAAHYNIEEVCYICQKFKKIKIICKKCTYPQKRHFCCSCYPPNNIAQCYCGRVLKQQKELNNGKCLLCRKKSQDIKGCRPCAYTICLPCMKKNSSISNKINIEPKQNYKNDENFSL